MRMESLVFSMLTIVVAVSGHGRLVEPPSRSSMWRYGFNTLPNYNDHELFCGGIGVQWSTNGGRCGVCGDPYNAPQPRPNEAGGKYAKGIIVRKYIKGQNIKVSVEVTANHLGYFKFKLCPHNNPKTVVSQECLDQHPLYLLDGSDRLEIKRNYLGFVNTTLKLPIDVTCSQCVFQWQYSGANNWGRCADGRGGLGCGPQETFRACADIAIQDQGVTDDISTVSSTQAPVTRRTTYKRRKTTKRMKNTTPSKIRTRPTTTVRSTTIAKDGRPKNCRASPSSRLPGLDFWCKTNCAMGHCPPDLCVC